MSIRKFKGFTLIEVLISLAILVFGLLGIAGLMAKGQHASFEAYQRQQALALAQDMAERIRANPGRPDHPEDGDDYVTGTDDANVMGHGTLVANGAIPNCMTANCSHQQLAEYDLKAWDRLLIGSSEALGANKVGGIINPRGCVERVGNLNRFVISVSWQGDSPTVAPKVLACKEADNVTDVPTSACGTGEYGDEKKRRLVSLCLGTRRDPVVGGS